MHTNASTLTAAGLLLLASSALGAPPGVEGVEHVEEELWLIRGCVVDAGPFVPGELRGIVPAPVVTVIDNGPPANRVDLVLVGDGYLASEMASFAAHVDNALDDMFNQQPFKRYAPLFNVHRVEVVSPESGVDNDPTQGVLRNTALDMRFWCNNIERLLCVSVSKAYDYALNAPDVDQVFAVANSVKYGGAGYPSNDLCTYSGGNSSAPEIAIHEIGHSLGDLADEYDYGGPANWTGGEPGTLNVSIYPSATMAAQERKWWRWLGFNATFNDGLIGTYEGANYSETGIYRPTNNSKMRSLGRPFNMPSIEGLLAAIYLEVDPIDDATPTGGVIPGAATLFVDPVDPVDAPLSIQWRLEGQPIAGATGPTLDLASLDLPPGMWDVSVVVVDNTDWVRDEALRASRMTSIRSWTVRGLIEGDLDGDGLVTFADLNLLLDQWQQTGPGLSGDFNDDGVVDFADLNILLGALNTGA